MELGPATHIRHPSTQELEGGIGHHLKVHSRSEVSLDSMRPSLKKEGRWHVSDCEAHKWQMLMGPGW